MADALKPPTKAQIAALRWLVSRGRGTDHRNSITGGAFVAYYQETTGQSYTTDRGHAWRRTGGRVLAEMARRGLVARAGTTWGSSEYVITNAGREAADG